MALLLQVLYSIRSERMLMEQLDYNLALPLVSRPVDGLPREERRNDTHQSTTGPDARLATKSKGQEAKLFFAGHVVMENRNGLAVGARLTHATGKAEQGAALKLLGDIPRRRRISLGADKGYDVRAFVRELRQGEVTPNVARKKRYSALDGRTTRLATYQVSQRMRKRVEEIFGWLKTVGMTRKLRHRGLPRAGWTFTFAVAAYNLVRIREPQCGARMKRPPKDSGFGDSPRGESLQVLLEGRSLAAVASLDQSE